MQKDGRRVWFHFHWPFAASAGPQIVHVRADLSGHGELVNAADLLEDPGSRIDG